MEPLHVIERGEGEPILLIHGWLSSHGQMLKLLPALDGYTAVLPDLLGCGESDKTMRPALIAENVRLLRELCERRGITTVIGYSLGGAIAIELQLPHTILLATFCESPLITEQYRRLTGHEAKITEFLRTNNARIERFRSRAERYLPPEKVAASLACSTQYLHEVQENRTALAKRLPHVLVVHGTRDLLIPHELGMRLASVAGAQFVSVPENHNTVLRSELVHSAIKSFLAHRRSHEP